MSTYWYVATITNGIEIPGLRTGERVVFRIELGKVQLIGHGDRTAILSVDAARRHLETVRNARTWRPVPARGQGRLSIKWDQLRGWRKFGTVGRPAAVAA